jgi:hypothetical protein
MLRHYNDVRNSAIWTGDVEFVNVPFLSIGCGNVRIGRIRYRLGAGFGIHSLVQWLSENFLAEGQMHH